MSFIYFVSFADKTFVRALERISREARESGIFKDVFAMEPKDFSSEFLESHADLLKHKRGYGYWCWKFYIILETLKKIPEGSWVFYADAGCTLIKDRAETVIAEIKNAEKVGKDIIVYQMPNIIERKWTKTSLFTHLGVLDDPHITGTGQYVGGIVRAKNTAFSRDFYAKLLQVSHTHPELLDDSPSPLPNDPEFKEHRHDQSIFSVLSKMHPEHIYIISPNETEGGKSFAQATRKKN